MNDKQKKTLAGIMATLGLKETEPGSGKFTGSNGLKGEVHVLPDEPIREEFTDLVWQASGGKERARTDKTSPFRPLPDADEKPNVPSAGHAPSPDMERFEKKVAEYLGISLDEVRQHSAVARAAERAAEAARKEPPVPEPDEIDVPVIVTQIFSVLHEALDRRIDPEVAIRFTDKMLHFHAWVVRFQMARAMGQYPDDSGASRSFIERSLKHAAAEIDARAKGLREEVNAVLTTFYGKPN